MKAVNIEVMEGRVAKLVTFELHTGTDSIALHATESELASSYPVAFRPSGYDSSLIALDRRTADELLGRLKAC